MAGRETNEPLYREGRPIKPSYLTPIASEHWDIVVEQLEDGHVLTVADGFALEMMCEAYATYRKYKAIVDATPLIKGSTFAYISNPLERMMKNAYALYNRYLESFGLTPRDRRRVKAFKRPMRLMEVKSELTRIESAANQPPNAADFSDVSSLINAQVKIEAQKMREANGHITTQAASA